MQTLVFDLSWPKLLLIGAVALIFFGPKDLPNALRIAGYWFRRARTLSSELQNGVEQMIRAAELDQMRRELKKATEFNLDEEFRRTVAPTGEFTRSIERPDLPDDFELGCAASNLIG